MDNKLDKGFSPAIWPEAQAPLEFSDCRNCELHCQRKRVIWGEGNPYAPIIILLDNPGAREDKEGKPFVCGTRKMLQTAAYESGLNMEDLFVTFVLKCRPIRKYDKETSRSTCMAYLYRQIEMQKPKYAFCLGNVAVQSFFGDKEAEVKNLRGSWHSIKGIPTIVTYHPLAVVRRPNLYSNFVSDWNILSQRYHSE